MFERGQKRSAVIDGVCHTNGRELMFGANAVGQSFQAAMYCWLQAAGFDHVVSPYRIRIQIEATRLTKEQAKRYWKGEDD